MKDKFQAAAFWFGQDPRRVQAIFLGLSVLLTLAALTGLAPHLPLIADPSGGGSGGSGGII